MSTLDVAANEVRDRAAQVRPPSLSTIVVTLIGLLPWLLGWTLNAGWQVLRLIAAAFLKGWEVGETTMGPAPKASGGS